MINKIDLSQSWRVGKSIPDRIQPGSGIRAMRWNDLAVSNFGFPREGAAAGSLNLTGPDAGGGLADKSRPVLLDRGKARPSVR